MGRLSSRDELWELLGEALGSCCSPRLQLSVSRGVQGWEQLLGDTSCSPGDAELPGACLAFLGTWLSVATRAFLRVRAACQLCCLRLEEILPIP